MPIMEIRSNINPKVEEGSGLDQLLVDLVRESDHPKRMLALACSHVGATAGTFWRRGLYSNEIFELAAVHNRTDLTADISLCEFDINDEDISAKLAFAERKVISGTLGEPPFSGKWLQKPYTKDIPKLGITSVSLIPIFDENHTPVAVLSLYFTVPPHRIFNDEHLLAIGRMVYYVFEKIIYALRREKAERRKVNHEIFAQARKANEALSKLNQYIKNAYFPPPADKLTALAIRDVSQAISTIKTSTHNNDFRNIIRSRRDVATFTNFRLAFNSAAQPQVRNISRRRLQLAPLEMHTDNPKILIDKDDLNQIITNLISNSLKYGLDNTAISSRFLIERDTDQGHFTVSNVSRGLSELDQKRIWDFGHRGKNAKGSDGQGIGLAIVREICEEYGFTFNYQQKELESGRFISTFEIRIPNSLILWE
jgi:hypothetical protein